MVSCTSKNNEPKKDVNLKDWLISENNDSVSLNDWLIDERNINKFRSMVSTGSFDCGALSAFANTFKITEFKIQTYLSLAACYENANKQEKVKEYLINAVASGFHIDRIDSIKYKNALKHIHTRLIEEHHNFWSNRDTTYFQEIEQWFIDDQKYNN